MEGGTDERMGEALDHAEVCIIFVSKAYKHSANCHFESSYANQLKKRGKLVLIFVMMDPTYTTVSKPDFVDGWLGFMIGDALWYPLFNESHVESTARAITKVVGDRCQRGGTAPPLAPLASPPPPPIPTPTPSSSSVSESEKILSEALVEKDKALADMHKVLMEKDKMLIDSLAEKDRALMQMISEKNAQTERLQQEIQSMQARILALETSSTSQLARRSDTAAAVSSISPDLKEILRTTIANAWKDRNF